MPQRISPFLEVKYGWSFGESGWNVGMDENLLKFSFHFQNTVDAIVSTLPTASTNRAYYLTTDNRIYYTVDGVYYSTPVPKWYTFKLKDTGEKFQFDGNSVLPVPDISELSEQVSSLESSLGTAAFKDDEFFASRAYVDGELAKIDVEAIEDSFALQSQTSPGADKVGYKGTTLFGRFKNTHHVSDWGIVGTDFQEAPINEGAKLLQAVNDVAAANSTLLFDARNYMTDRTLLVEGAFRSFKLQGAGTGNSNIASSAGTTIFSSSSHRTIQVKFDQFSNENFRMDGLNFYDLDQNLNGFEAISVVRGADNNRYISGFVFRDVGIKGFGAGFSWQGMNLDNTGLNYMGHTILDNVSISDTGIGLLLSNCSLNLLDLRSVLLHNCPQGGLRLERDGAVGDGNGLGSSIVVHISGKSHFEDCAGMFRTQQQRVMGGEGTSSYLRSTIHMDGLLHEFCGTTTRPTTGDPFCLGVDTDVIVTGDVNYDLGYGEDSFPKIGPGNTITSSSRMRCDMIGGRSFSPLLVNAPIIRRSIPNGQSTLIRLTTPEAVAYAIKSKLVLQRGAFGVIEGTHSGMPSGTKYNTTSAPTPALATSGLTVTYAAGAAGDVLHCTVANNSGQAIDVEMQVENISSCTILTASEV